MLATLALALPILGAAPQAQAIAPQTASWQDLRRNFPAAWEFPRLDARGRALPSSLFEDRLQALALRPLVGSVEQGDAIFLGDLIRTCSALGWDPERTQVLLETLSQSLSAADMEVLQGLLLCIGLSHPDWGPSKEKHDGLHFGATWDLPEGYWLEHDGSRSVEQAATLILADLPAIKAAENDYPSYFRFPDNDYLQVDPKPGTYLRVPEEGGETCVAAGLDVRFHSDLPFPFTTYSLDLAILHRQTQEEDLRTFVFGRSEDLHWLAGYDRFWTVRDGKGQPVATLLVRQLAFDISGVPDKSKHRRLGIRSGLGNLRRNAERLFAGRWSDPEPAQAGVPAFPVMAPAK